MMRLTIRAMALFTCAVKILRSPFLAALVPDCSRGGFLAVVRDERRLACRELAYWLRLTRKGPLDGE